MDLNLATLCSLWQLALSGECWTLWYAYNLQLNKKYTQAWEHFDSEPLKIEVQGPKAPYEVSKTQKTFFKRLVGRYRTADWRFKNRWNADSSHACILKFAKILRWIEGEMTRRGVGEWERKAVGTCEGWSEP